MKLVPYQRLCVRTVPLRHDRPGRPPGGWGVLCTLCDGPVFGSVRPTRLEAWHVALDHADDHAAGRVPVPVA